MKNITKIFIISFICFFIAMSLGSYSYVKRDEIKIENKVGGSLFSPKVKERKEIEYYSTLEEAKEKSERINFLILGMEDVRTDTIILASFSPTDKKVDLINIPRDTYIHRKGYDDPTQRKINSVYQEHGIKGLKKTVSYILEDIDIHHHIILDYKGVEKIVDELGGIEVDVPFNMKYDDPMSDPPTSIDIKKGKQLLNGKNSIDFLRYRKGNDNSGYLEGDIGRIKAQQDFMASFIDKSLDNMITVIRNGYGYLKTDISLLSSVTYGRNAIGMKKDDFEVQILPGESEFKKVKKRILSYYIYDKKEINKVIKELYNVKDPGSSD